MSVRSTGEPELHSRRKPGRQSGSLVLALLFFGCPAGLLGQTELETAHSHLEQLWQDRRGARDPKSRERIMTEVRSFLPHEQRLIDEGILDALNHTRRPSDQQLEDTLRRTLTSTSEPQSESAAVLSGAGGSWYVVVYTIPWCAVCSLSSMDVFALSGGRYKMAAHINDPLPNRSVALLSLRSPSPGEFWFLAYGTNWGDPHEHLTAIAYVFDGHKLASTWSRVDLPRGQIKLVKGAIVLTFHTAVDTPGRPPSKERTEIYQVTPDGVKFERASEKAVQ